jgi:hypothetical protein
MNKRILAGLVLLPVAVAGYWSTAIGTATPAYSTAFSATAAPASGAAAAAQSDCTAGEPEQWNLSGANEVDVAYDGLSFVYGITITQNGSCLSGTLDDPYYPTSGPISGTVSGDSITFTFTYPSGSIQGTRTYTGTISQSGVASGTWTQTGDESPDNGTWTLADKSTTAPASSLSVDAGANQTILGTNIISLDGQVTGDAADVAWTQVSGPGTTNFASSDSAATKATVSTPGIYVFQLTAENDGTSASDQVTITVQAYVALGDSYSAGDGAGDYLADSADPLCLQSANAYPELVDAKVAGANAIPAGTANPAFVFAACTGAEIPDFNSLQSDNQPAQLSYLKNLPANSVGLVTLTIGGNDAGFGKVMEYCAQRKPKKESCQEHSQAAVNRIILNQLPLDLYEQIKSEPSLAPDAQILVLGYPQFFPTGQATSCRTGLVTGALGDKFQPSDMAWIDSVIKLVDSDIQASAFAAGLTYVDTSDAFAGHQLCQRDPDLNDAVVGPVLLAAGYPKGVQSFHPNVAGQSVLAQNVSPVVPFPAS